MARHRGQFKLDNEEPYELSRSRVENFIRCPACFYMQQVEGIQFPSIPGFNINEATDILFKRDFDELRGTGNPHPFLERTGFGHLSPFAHEHFELWTQSLHFGAENRMNTVHEPTKLKIGGGLDDVWVNSQTGLLHIVDYKSTSQKSPNKAITLDDTWKNAYKRQMDLYVWIMRRKGFEVSSEGYFLYCDGDRFSNYQFLGKDSAVMRFKMQLIAYEVKTDWVEEALFDIHKCLRAEKRPPHSPECEYGQFLFAAK